MNPADPIALNFPCRLADAFGLMGVLEADRPAARTRLYGQGLVTDGLTGPLIDLADPRVAAVLQLPSQRGREALAEARAQDRALTLRMAARRRNY